MYVYQADTWCDSCGEAIREELANVAPVLIDDPHTFDSDDYPKWAQEGECDYPNHCASADECTEGIDLRKYGYPVLAPEDGSPADYMVGAVLESLTDEGEAYAREMMANDDPTPYQSALYRLWEEVYQL